MYLATVLRTSAQILATLRLQIRSEREANESKYWLKIMDRLDIGNKGKRTLLLKEAEEIALILGSIVSKLERKIKKA